MLRALGYGSSFDLASLSGFKIVSVSLDYSVLFYDGIIASSEGPEGVTGSLGSSGTGSTGSLGIGSTGSTGTGSTGSTGSTGTGSIGSIGTGSTGSSWSC